MSAIEKLIARLPGRRKVEPDEPRVVGNWTVGGVRFDDSGLAAGTASATSMAWTDHLGTEVALTVSARVRPPEFLDLNQARVEHRHIAAAEGRSLVSVECVSAQQGIPLLEVITKGRVGPGFDYGGTLVADDGEQTFVVRITASERPVSGLREAAISAQMWELGEVELLPPASRGASQALKGWSLDPYDAAWDENALNSITDDERLDLMFPDHSLTRVRLLLRQVRRSLVLDRVPVGSTGGLGNASTRRGQVPASILCELLWKQSHFHALEALLSEGLARADDAAEDSDTAERLLLLGVVQARRERHLDARRTLTRAHDVLRRRRGDAEVLTAIALGHLARANLDLGNLSVAEQQFSAALEIIEPALPDSLALAMMLSGYGRALIARNNAEAMHYVTRAKGIVERIGGGPRLFLLRESMGASPPNFTTRLTTVQPPR